MRAWLCAALIAAQSVACSAHAADTGAPATDAGAPTAPNKGIGRWFDPSTAPFIPIPEIDVDPQSGTTLGIIPTWLHTDEHDNITRIVAPDVLYNPYFGFGARARVFAYPSDDTQWSAVAGGKQRVEREFDAEYQSGRLREQRWSFGASLIYDRSGTPRFYGIGDHSPAIAESDYTDQQELAEARLGLNLTHTWQVLYTLHFHVVDVQPGTLAGIASLDHRFGRILGVGTNHELLNRFALIYDTRDDLTVPTRGLQWVVYGGLASRHGFLDNSLYSEAGTDARSYWPIGERTTLAAHVALRYLPTARRVPFWALSSIGGDSSAIGGSQPLRGYGTARFYGRNSFSANLELRKAVMSFNAVSTHIDLEMTPFLDLGDVFARTTAWPLSGLHPVGGLGFRGIARPFVVGYVDIGYGGEGVAVFTGINYPF